jgi:OCT family organic cation transporter-like MFS transporter 4/5
VLFPGDTDLEWVTIMLAMAGKFSVSSSNAVMPVFTAELFPTVVRNLGVGSSNVSAGIALMLVPYLWNLVSTAQTLVILVAASGDPKRNGPSTLYTHSSVR